MRKIVISVIAIALSVMALVGCNIREEDKNDLEWLKASYSKVGEASKIEESTEISAGSLVKYIRAKQYVKDGEEYKVSGTTKTLNEVSENGDPYTETTDEPATVKKSEVYAMKMDLSESNFDEHKLDENGLVGKITDGRLDEVLGLDESDAENATLTIKVENDKVTSVEITYLQGDDSVKISLKISY